MASCSAFASDAVAITAQNATETSAANLTSVPDRRYLGSTRDLCVKRQATRQVASSQGAIHLLLSS